jgi:hypothetical protein
MALSALLKPRDVRLFIHRFGFYSGVRAARNRGVPFAITYYSVFGKLPRD